MTAEFQDNMWYPYVTGMIRQSFEYELLINDILERHTDTAQCKVGF